jgi:hypothetical protein
LPARRHYEPSGKSPKVRPGNPADLVLNLHVENSPGVVAEEGNHRGE